LLILFFPSFIGIFYKDPTIIFERSGFIGFFLSTFFSNYLGFWGSLISLSIIITVSLIVLCGYFFIDIFSVFWGGAVKLIDFSKEIFKERRRVRKVVTEKKIFKERVPKIKIYTPKPESQPKSLKELERKELEKPAVSREEIKKRIEALESTTIKVFDAASFKLPSINLLKPPPVLDAREVKEDIKDNIKNLEETLTDFGVQARVVSVQKGPVVTRYELEPQAGVKIHRITTLADDIALAMKSSSVRIVAPIPGRGTVGVEVPNRKKYFVYLREVLQEEQFIQASSKLTLAIGKDVKGDPVIADLGDMPHLLIAGTTGSGKTVCVNSIISSILFKAKPDEVKFILVDPKMVELAPFSGIPHLISPIIYEAKKAFAALNWAVEEMETRYKLLAETGVRNLDAYNKVEKHLPYIVIVIDELADLMVVAKESIESAIQRLAQLSRAVGIHLILATQRPSVDVVTGVIKANFPARISFKVSSKVDSRTVLDMIGADKLLGQGDLLFLKPGAPRPIRAQGSYIDDEDIQKLTNFVRTQGAPIYEEKITEAQTQTQIRGEEDHLFEEAVKIVLSTRQASASFLQRRLRVGYTRAARLLDFMEEAGIVGPFCGSKAREILVDPESYLKEKGLI
jgi:S-DNA-T family DNA segregation ATPase FtsK/SpoIIIE